VAVLFLGALIVVNVEYPRGLMPMLEQLLHLGDNYNDDGDQQSALNCYASGLLVLDPRRRAPMRRGFRSSSAPA